MGEKEFPLKTIKNDAEHACATAMVSELMGRKLDRGADDYLDTLIVLVNKYEDGRVSGLGAVSWYITLVTNTKQYPEAPTSWAALWDPKNKDKLGLLALGRSGLALSFLA